MRRSSLIRIDTWGLGGGVCGNKRYRFLQQRHGSSNKTDKPTGDKKASLASH